MKMTSHKFLAALLFVVALTLQTCSSSETQPTSPDHNSNPAALLVIPSSGASGALLKISGYTLNPSDTGIELLVGDQPTPFTADSSGLRALIPLFLDTHTHWPAPPLNAQDVTIRKNGEVVALATAAVTVDSLPHADGSTAMLQNDFVKLTNSLRTIYSSLPTVPGTDPRLQGYQDAVMAMLDSLVAGADSSLESVLSGSSSWTSGQTPALSLIDAILASSGALDFYNEAAGSLGRLTDSLTLARQQGLLCKSGGPDMDLACQMQIYVVLDDYATYFVKPTTTTYANTVGMASGLIALSGVGVPGEAIVGALLTVFDLVYGTIAPSLFPAELTDFSLTVATDTIGIDELTNTAVLVSATNHPATIKATDVLKQLISLLGLTKDRNTELIKSATEFLKNAMDWALDMYRNAVIQSNTQSGGAIFIDPTADLPQMTWGPVSVTNPDLVELYSFTEDIITADTGAFEWKGVTRGEGRIQARGRAAGERSKVLLDNTLCFGCIYAGGAFGNNAPGTATKTVVVGKPASINVQITGLPSGVDGNVVVVGPGYSSGQLPSSKLLKDLELGNYTMTAVEARDNSGNTYKPDPLDTTVTLQDGAQATIAVTYKPKYGNLFLTVSGLGAGTNANIDVSGPNGALVHVVNDTLVDSLEPGNYTISATSVVDNQGQTRRPDPLSQTVTIVGGETALASVTYGGNLVVTTFYGAQKIFGAAEADYIDMGLVNDPNAQIVRTVFPDGYDTLGFQGDCSEVTGFPAGSLGGGDGADVGAAGASASGTLTVLTSGFKISSDARANASIGYDPTKHHHATGDTNFNFGVGNEVTGTNEGVVLDIQNPSGDTVDVVINWFVSASSSGTGGSRGSIAMSRALDPCGNRFYNNDEILVNYFSRDINPVNPSGTLTITLTDLHRQVAFSTEVSASALAVESTPSPGNSGSSSTTLSLTVSAKLRP